MVESHRIRLQIIVKDETTTAVEVALASIEQFRASLPKSLVAIEDKQPDGSATLLITQALATTKGLV